MKKRFYTPSRGFTLVELMVTLAVLAILLGIAIPNMQQFVQNSRLRSQASELVGDLNLARSEAIRRGVSVSTCPTTNGTSCAGATSWESGWMSFTDMDASGTVNGTDTVLRVSATLGGTNTLRTANRTFIRFSAQGYSVATADTFRVCDSRGVNLARTVTVSPQGRVTSAKGGASSCP